MSQLSNSESNKPTNIARRHDEVGINLRNSIEREAERRIVEWLRGLDGIEAALAGQHAWYDAANAIERGEHR